jgi:hypothetical protein
MSHEENNESTNQHEEHAEEPKGKDQTDSQKMQNTPETKEIDKMLKEIKQFEDNIRKIDETADLRYLHSDIERLGKYQKSTQTTIKIVTEAIKNNLLDTNTSENLKELENLFYDLNQELFDIPQISIVSQKIILNDVVNKIENNARIQDSIIAALEKMITQKEETLRQLRNLIQERKHTIS